MRLRRWRVTVAGEDMYGWERCFWRHSAALAYVARTQARDPELSAAVARR